MVTSRTVGWAILAGLLCVPVCLRTAARANDVGSARELLKSIRTQTAGRGRASYENRSSSDVVAASEQPAGQEPKPATAAQPPETAGQAESAGDELLRAIPAGCLFCVRVNNLGETLGRVDQFLGGALPVPIAVSMLVQANLAKLLGSQQPAGVDPAGNFACFAVSQSGGTPAAGPPAPPFVGVLVPVKDYRQFVEGNGNVAPPDQKGISRITSQGMPALVAGRFGRFSLITLAQYYDRLAALTGAGQPAAKASLAAVLQADQVAEAISSPVWAYVNMQQVREEYGPAMLAGLEAAKAQMEAAQSRSCVSNPEAASRIMDVYSSFVQVLMKEIQSLTLSLEPTASVCRLTATVAAVPGTDAAKALASEGAGESVNPLLGYLENGAAANMAFRINTPCWKKLYAVGLDMMEAMAGENMSAGDLEQIKSLGAEMLDSMGEYIAESVTINPQAVPPFSARYAFQVGDAEKYGNALEQLAAVWNNGPGGLYEKMGMKTRYVIKPKAQRYKGVWIDEAKLTMTADANSPEGKMIVAIYGGGFDYRWAVVNGLCVGVVGGDVDVAVRKLIDQAKAGSPGQVPSEIKTALELVPQAGRADFMVTFNVLRLAGFVRLFAPVPVAGTEVPTSGNIVVCGGVGDGKLTVTTAVPKQHLTEVIAAVQKLIQEKMKAARAGKTGPPAGAPVRPIAQQVVQGKIKGTTVTLEKAEVNNDGVVAIYTGDSWGGNPSVLLFVFDLKGAGVPENRTFVVEPGSGAEAPMVHVHFRWKDPDTGKIKTDVVTRGFGLQLRFGRQSGNTITGAILLDIPEQDTHIEGNFVAEIKTADKKSASGGSRGHDRITQGTARYPWRGQAGDSAGRGRNLNIVTVKVLGVTDYRTEETVAEQLNSLTGSRRAWLSYRRKGDTMTAQLGPVPDPRALAGKLGFGTVTSMDDNLIVVQLP